MALYEPASQDEGGGCSNPSALQHNQKSRNRHATVLPGRDPLEDHHDEARLLPNPAQRGRAMGVAGALAEEEAVALMRLDGEGKKPLAPQHPMRLAKRR